MLIDHPVLSCAEAVDLEREVLGGDPGAEWEAMRRAGEALSRAVELDFSEIGPWPEPARILILAGKGNNAGDAFLAASGIVGRHSRTTVEVFFLVGERALGELARRAWNDLLTVAGERVTFFSLRRGRPVSDQLEERLGERDFHLGLDGVFGMNFRPPFRTPVDAIVEWLNRFEGVALRAAVDVPSGLSDRAADLALRADFTYFTGSVKRPALEAANAKWAGRIRYLDIGFFDAASGRFAEKEMSVVRPEAPAFLRKLRDPLGHKKDHGHLLAIGGSRATPGAILMSVLAALESGAGLVTAFVPESVAAAFAARAPEAMWLGCPETEEGGLGLDGLHLLKRILPKIDAVLVGPGVGVEPETQAFFEETGRLIATPMVIDAEALQPKLLDVLGRRKDMAGKVLLTPHAGEYGRIAGTAFAESGEEGLRDYCRRSGFSVLLKGPPFTRICDADGRLRDVFPGGPVLARGGSGDILAGIAGSLLARDPGSPASAGAAAALWHGLAAECLARESGQHAVRTTRILDFLAAAARTP